MKCPKCSYEPTMSEHQASPEICPKCSVVYAKVQAAPVAATVSAPIVTPVAVVDITMPFGSMVWFMVKWVLASIPALLILVAIASFATGLYQGYQLYFAAKPVAITAPERISLSGSAEGEFWLLSLRDQDGLRRLTVMTTAADGARGYTDFAIDCTTGLGEMVSIQSRLELLSVNSPVPPLKAIERGTPRHDVARRGCRDWTSKHASLH